MTSVHDDHDHAVFTAPLDSFTTHLEHYDHHEHHDNYALNTQPLLQDELLLSGVDLDEGISSMSGLPNFEEDEFYDDFDEEEEDDEDEGFDEDDEEDMQAEDGADRANDGSDEGHGHGEGGHNLGHHDFLYEHHSEFEWLAHMDLSQHDMTQDLSSSMNVVEDESYFDEEHKKSGIFIPRDAENIEKMRNVLLQEFESETKFKTNELDQIEKRMKDIEAIWKRLQKSWSGRIYDAALLYEINNDTGGKKKKKRNKNRTNIGNLYARNPDGTFVKLVCPVCKRVDFATQLGFVNHCRIMHRLKFSSYEDATIHCGVPVSESEVPPEDPARLSKPLSYFVNRKKTEFDPGSPSSSVVYMGERRAESYFEREARSSSDTEDGDQKPYIRKVIVGSTSKMLAPEHLGSDGKTHKWMVYVRGRKETSDVSKFIQKVRFFLHPTYAPDDIVEVRAPPFQITRRGNGHPVRLQIYLADGKTAPVHVVHALRLDFTTIGLQKMGTEQEVIIELDPEFCDRLDQESNSENTHTPEHYPLTGHKRRLEDDTEEGRRKRQKITDNDVGSFLKIEAEMRFPLVSEEKSGKLPFSCAKTAEQWTSWSLGKRKSSEWQRARRLRIRLEEELNINQTGLWTTKRIATFLRESGMTPPCKTQGNYDEMYQQQLIQYEQMKLRKATKKTLAKKIVFCQFCGCAHFPVDQFDELERRCGDRKKVLLQSNLSSFAELNARSSAPLQPLTLVPPPRLLAPIAAQSKTGHVVLTTGANQQRQLVYISTGPLSQQQQNALMLKNHVVAVPAKPSQSSTGPRPIASAGQLPNIAPKPVLVQALNNNVVPSNAILVASDCAQMAPIAVHSEDKEKKAEAPHVHDNKSTASEHSAATPLAIPVTTATPGTLVNIPNTNATPVNNTNTTPSNTVNTTTPTIPTTNTNTNINTATLSPNIARPTQPSPGAVTHVNGMPVHANNIVQVKTQHGTTNAVALPPGAVKVPVSVPGVVAVPAHHAVPVPDKLIHSSPVLSDNEAAWIRTVLGEIGVQVDEDSNKQVESVLFKAMMMFTQSLLHECQSVFINERNQDQATEKPFKVMVPNHVLTAILQNKNFDFLTNHGLQRKD